MDFTDTLAAIQAMVGRQVDVVIGADPPGPHILCVYNGTLALGWDVDERDPDIENFLFAFSEHGEHAGFFLSSEHFESAELSERQPGSPRLEIRLGPIEIELQAEAPSPAT